MRFSPIGLPSTLPCTRHALADLVAAAEVRDLVEPGERQQPGLVAQHAFEDAALRAADVAFGEVRDLADDAGDLADAQAADRAQRAPILVAERQVVEQVLDRRDAELLELLGAARADAAQRTAPTAPAPSDGRATSPVVRRYGGELLGGLPCRKRSTSARQRSRQRARRCSGGAAVVRGELRRTALPGRGARGAGGSALHQRLRARDEALPSAAAVRAAASGGRAGEKVAAAPTTPRGIRRAAAPAPRRPLAVTAPRRHRQQRLHSSRSRR